VVGLVVAPRRRQRQQHPRRPWHAAETGAGGGQHQPPHPVRRLPGQLLGDHAAEGDAQHVDLVVAERLQHSVHGPRHAGHPAWPAVRGGLPDAGRIEADGLHPTGGQLPLERLGQVQAGPEPGDDEQRTARSADRGAQPHPVDVDQPDRGLVR
jgi:hypothetical protein